MLRLLAALSIIQIFTIAFLAARVIEIDASVRLLENSAAARIAAAPTPAAGYGSAGAVTAEAPLVASDLEALRRIIREEFAAQRAAAPAPALAPIAQKPADPRLVDAARGDLGRLIARRNVGTRDLDLYLEKIAKLPAAERTEALRALTKAMNEGRIDGRF